MKVLNRPMFRYGGPIKEGVMSGIKERVPLDKGGYLKNLTGAIANFYNPIKKAKPVQKIIQKIKPTAIPKFRKENMYGLPVGSRGKISDRVTKIPTSERAGMFVRKNPIYSGVGLGVGSQYGLDALKGGANLLEKGVLQVGDLLVRDKYFDQDKYMKENYPDGFLNTIFGGGKKKKLEDDIKKSTQTANEKRIKELEALLATDTSVNQGKTPEEIRQERIQKYRDIVDIKGMNKDAAYDSLIAASAAVNEAGGDLKGAIKDGSLINRIIQSTSKAFDKPKATKDAIDTLILKGEIESDIAAGKPSTYLKAAQDMVATGAAKNITEAMKTLTKSENSMSTTLGGILARGNRLDEKTVGVAYREETGNIPAGSVKISVVNEWKDDNKGKNEIDYLQSITEGEQLDAGDYIIGERVVTVAKDGSMSYFY
jgi:hypothetical protein